MKVTLQPYGLYATIDESDQRYQGRGYGRAGLAPLTLLRTE